MSVGSNPMTGPGNPADHRPTVSPTDARPDVDCPADRLDSADAETRLGHELLGRLLGGPAALRAKEVSVGAGAGPDAAERFWHALGFPLAEDDEAMFAEADVEALRRITGLVAHHELDETTALSTTRAFARTMDRLSVWQTQLMAESLMSPEQEAAIGEKDSRTVSDRGVAAAASTRLVDLVDELEPLLVYAWRRHLAAAITRMLADSDPDDDSAAGNPTRVVGFADLVNFTALVRRMTERQLAVLVQRFEALASDIITAHGGRVIKTVGDEVLFVHQHVAPAAAIALDLVEAMAEDPLLPDVRVAMSYGPMVSRLGDVFGTTVNRASRLTAVTPPGRVLVDDTLARPIGAVSGFELHPQRRRHLRGIGTVTPSELARTTGTRPREEHG